MRNLIVMLFLGTFLGGCSATMPETIQVAENTKLSDYSAVKQAIKFSVGETVRWGGVVAATENKVDGTEMEIVHLELNSFGRPIWSDYTDGRFKVQLDKFLDPLVYAEGRLITFTGKVSGAEQGQVGEYQYEFPVIKADGFQLWKNVQKVDVTVHDFGFGRGYYPWRYPYYWGYPHYRRFTVTTHGGGVPPKQTVNPSPKNKYDDGNNRQITPIKTRPENTL